MGTEFLNFIAILYKIIICISHWYMAVMVSLDIFLKLRKFNKIYAIKSYTVELAAVICPKTAEILPRQQVIFFNKYLQLPRSMFFVVLAD